MTASRKETTMNKAPEVHDEQAKRWNGLSGRNWVAAQPLLDALFAPLEKLLAETVLARGPRRTLDVGCGTGAVTLAAARALGGKGRFTGVDISEPMVAAARERAQKEDAPADFIVADAQRYLFEPASYDMIVSRFGVMFFDDSAAAFANLRRAAATGAALRFIAWRSPGENPFMTTAEHAAAPLLPDLPPHQPGAPGQFAFADEQRVRRILEESGWSGIEIAPVDIECVFPENELVRYFTLLGPLSAILPKTDEPARSRIIETVRAAFQSYMHGSEVRFTAACWMADARAE